MNDPTQIRIADYHYNLPEDRIAQFPLQERDESKLLIYRNRQISQDVFSNIACHLPEHSLLVFNNTRVIRTRLIFHKSTGAAVEIFCLEPLAPSAELQTAFLQKSGTTWKCLIGNLKRWKTGTLILQVISEGQTYNLSATRTSDLKDGSHSVLFEWDPPEISFSAVLELAGLTPLPPYINRTPEISDIDRYQTIYAAKDGSVAAPTAGLHFTEGVLESLRQKNIQSLNVTLHVGAGTFRPVITELIGDHLMHPEKIIVSRETIEQLLENIDRPVFAVGTTAARTLESLYWLGCRLSNGDTLNHPIVSQWTPYQNNHSADIPSYQSLESLLKYLKKNDLDSYSGETRLMIVPGYRYRLLSGLITNFHVPQSTLLLLVAAMIGPVWKEVYDFALAKGYRFLSYGDACLFFLPKRG
ncbi:MAG: S-adenosylmethionine:tRNA ribosyltransferase-isomerase [Bacteroidetes bacterium]|nr:S-adenosylmethionine:tRNA ribosyltransferase-isomerase [Bacteroidota bacterium]